MGYSRGDILVASQMLWSERNALFRIYLYVVVSVAVAAVADAAPASAPGPSAGSFCCAAFETEPGRPRHSHDDLPPVVGRL